MSLKMTPLSILVMLIAVGFFVSSILRAADTTEEAADTIDEEECYCDCYPKIPTPGLTESTPLMRDNAQMHAQNRFNCRDGAATCMTSFCDNIKCITTVSCACAACCYFGGPYIWGALLP